MTKEHEKEANDKLRAGELLALADTIKIVNDDDALDLFKKTLSTPSLLQVTVTSKAMKQQALAALMQRRKHHRRDPRLNLISMAIRGKKVSFDKVVKMIDDMATLLKKEQVSDDTKKAYCEKNIDANEDELKEVELDIKDLGKAISEHKENIKTAAAELKALTDGIISLDKQVKDSTKQRKEENAEYEETMASDGAAKELLALAKNRLNKFYSPKLYKAPPKRKLSEEEQITVNMGGTLAPTAAPGGIAGTGVTVLAAVSNHAAPPPPPETAAAFSKKSEESNGVIAMIDLMVKDLTKEMTEAKAEEENAQEDYEKAMKDAAEKRATDSKTLATKQKEKAELEAELEANAEEKGATEKTLMATLEHIQALHAECDWLLQYYEVRKEARAGEVESLKTAKAVLSGADFSLLETGTKRRSLRGNVA